MLLAVAASLLPAGELTAAGESIPAFPGAEGFGAHSRGGRGGAVLLVTNLEDYLPGREKPIPGSLRAACDREGPRMVLFRVSGTIPLKSTLSIRRPFITMAGQTAPGGGICLRNHGVSIRTHDVVLRYLRCRPGDTVGKRLAGEGKSWSTDALSVGAPGRDVIIDHCSASWANDEVCSVSGAGISKITVQWCIISESLNKSTHGKGSHGYGSLIRCNGDVSYHHNLYAFHRSRSPRPGTYGEGSILFDFRNNFMYLGGRGYSAADPVRMNFIANFHPTTPFIATEACEHYSSGNTGTIRGGKSRKTPFEVAPVRTTSAGEAREAVLASSGAILPLRDAVDARVVKLAADGAGGLIDSQDEVGGWPLLKSARPPADGDRDGMPDSWERKHGLDPDSPDDRGDPDGDGYTNIEEYLNGTSPG